MAKRKYGQIVSLASVAAFMSPIDLAPYGVAKSGTIGLTRSMALELADYGITAKAIAPGPIDTEMVRAAWSKEALEERANHLPIRRLGRTEERCSRAHCGDIRASPLIRTVRNRPRSLGSPGAIFTSCI